MAHSKPKLALVLIDQHGETSVVKTSKLTPATKIKVAGRPKLQIGKQQHLVEVLELSDCKTSLKENAVNWSTTHRGIAVEREIARRDRSNSVVEGGFLDIWPDEEINNRNQPATKKRPASNKTTKPSAAKKPKTSAPEASTSQFPYQLQVTN